MHVKRFAILSRKGKVLFLIKFLLHAKHVLIIPTRNIRVEFLEMAALLHSEEKNHRVVFVGLEDELLTRFVQIYIYTIPNAY